VAIDIKALHQATLGDPATKLTVKREWLTEVHALLVQGQKDARALAALLEMEQNRRVKDPTKGDIFDKLFGNRHQRY
jgi:hypothetical protein